MRQLQKKAKRRAALPARFVYTFKIGWFTALNVKLEEVAINEVVLRVPLPPELEAQKEQNREDDCSSPVKPIKKSGHKVGDSSSKQSPQKRSAEHNQLITKAKRRRLSVGKDLKTQRRSVPLETKPSSSAFSRSAKRRTLNGETSPHKHSSPTIQFKECFVSLSTISTKESRPVNGSKNSSRKQSPSKSLLKQSQTPKRKVKSEFASARQAVSADIKKDDFFANKLRLKLKQLVQSPTSGQTRLTVDFAQLSDYVSHMKLPSKQWKVTVLMNRDASLVFEFINQTASRYVRFAETSPHCNIVVTGKSVVLLGCPKTVDSVRDIEILLEIVDTLDLKDCMIFTTS